MSKTIRVTVDFAKDLYNELEDIAKDLDISKAEALRKSMRVMETLLQEIKKGGKIIIKNGNSTKELLII